jgi:hypothetical protein
MWNGEERRKEMRYCEGHIELIATVSRIEERLIAVDKRINGSIDDITKHIEHGSKWRLAIVGLALGLILFTIKTIDAQARINQLVEINTEKWHQLENGKY